MSHERGAAITIHTAALLLERVPVIFEEQYRKNHPQLFSDWVNNLPCMAEKNIFGGYYGYSG